MKKAAFFDIDGTLIKGQIVLDFPFFLMKRKFFSRVSYIKILFIVAAYGAGFFKYREAGIRILSIYSDALKGRSEEEINEFSKAFAKEHIKKAYSYSKPLLDCLKKNYLLVAVSAAPIDPINALGNYFPFDKIFATEREIKNNVCTGKIKIDMLKIDAKKNILLTFSKKSNIDLKNSFAFGDSGSDAEFLSVVGKPVALNPNRKLRKIALKNKWTILTEQDDVVGKINFICNNPREK